MRYLNDSNMATTYLADGVKEQVVRGPPAMVLGRFLCFSEPPHPIRGTHAFARTHAPLTRPVWADRWAGNISMQLRNGRSRRGLTLHVAAQPGVLDKGVV